MHKKLEVGSNNRSVMPLDVLGSARATIGKRLCLILLFEKSKEIMNFIYIWDHALELLCVNQEYLVSVCHQRSLNTSLPFVHTARRSYRLNKLVIRLDKEISS